MSGTHQARISEASRVTGAALNALSASPGEWLPVALRFVERLIRPFQRGHKWIPDTLKAASTRRARPADARGAACYECP
ncbi:hypothetical protein F6X37_13005 [Paraburkholderia sp. 31.1]|uniref:hypothetical protein n=1 Tax=Paraburkholderia sp. 31.1 TaxID=2615205 RepID=UPI001654F031|nr:hypothetical protein [Paraburkholderia sp. 31.1]MBC8722488.1 hypothetical protein [Paraburkholderia sp. 31.1]